MSATPPITFTTVRPLPVSVSASARTSDPRGVDFAVDVAARAVVVPVFLDAGDVCEEAGWVFVPAGFAAEVGACRGAGEELEEVTSNEAHPLCGPFDSKLPHIL
jgi:hypothetical protein